MSPSVPAKVTTALGIENIPNTYAVKTHETKVVGLINYQNEDVELP